LKNDSIYKAVFEYLKCYSFLEGAGDEQKIRIKQKIPTISKISRGNIEYSHIELGIYLSNSSHEN
jgi:hypothetical protein